MFAVIDQLIAHYASPASISNLGVEDENQAGGLQLPVRERLEIIVHKLKFIPSEQRPIVAIIPSLQTSNSLQSPYLNNLIELSGGIPYSEEMVPLEAHVLLLLTDNPLHNLLGNLTESLQHSPWGSSKAIQDNRFYLAQQGAYLNENNPNLAEDAEILAEIIHPKYFYFGKDEQIWMPFSLS